MELIQVKKYNNVQLAKKNYTMVFTLGNGSMVDEPRQRGWVLTGYNFAKFFHSKKEAELEMRARV